MKQINVLTAFLDGASGEVERKHMPVIVKSYCCSLVILKLNNNYVNMNRLYL